MTTARIRPRTIPALLIATGLVTVLALTGCVDQSSAPTGSPSPSQSGSGGPSSVHTADPSVPTPVTIACTSILTSQQVYNYNPNYVIDTGYKPAAGSLGMQAVTDKGRVCGWVNETSNADIEVAVASPAAADLASLKSTAEKGTPVQLGGGLTGYFQVANGVGQLQVVSVQYWVIISSSDFISPADVAPLAQVVLGNLVSH